MRAKLPETEGFAERNGNRIHYEVYGQGPQTMVFLPPWSIVHSRIYKAQIPYFSERFRCIAYDLPAGGGDGARQLVRGEHRPRQLGLRHHLVVRQRLGVDRLVVPRYRRRSPPSRDRPVRTGRPPPPIWSACAR